MEMTITKRDEQINNIVNQIISNSKDEVKARELIQQLGGLYQMDKIIDVPLKDVSDKLDLGANVLYKVRSGYVWECKGGMITFVEHRMSRVCAMLNTLFELRESEDKELYDSFSTAVAYIFQCPIFSSLDERALFQNATAILNSYTEYCTEYYTNAEAPERSENDYKEDAEFEQQGAAIKSIVNAPIPSED